MRVMITGATGFIGRHVLQVMTMTGQPPKSEILVWDRVEHGSFMDPAARAVAMRDLQPDAVLHLAWHATGQLGYEHALSNEDWCEATVDLARLCTNGDAWFVGMGSCVEESLPDAQDTAYARAKSRAHINTSATVDPLLYTWMRPTWIVSLAEGRPRLVGAAQEAVRKRRAFMPKEPERLLDFIAVEDVASAIVTILRHRIVGDQDIGSGFLHSVSEVVQIATGAPTRPTSNLDLRRRGSERRSAVDISSLLAHGWAPAVTHSLFDPLGRGAL